MTTYTVNRTDFWQYDPGTDQWTEVAGAEFPTERTAWSTGFAVGTQAFFGLGVDFPAFSFSNTFYRADFANLTGISELPKHPHLLLYPVPAGNTLRLEMEVDGVLEKVIVTDSKGMLCGTFEGAVVDISTLPPGVYFLKAYTTQGVFPATFTKQ